MKKPDTQISTQLTFRNGELVLPVIVDANQETVWLNRQQMAKLFDRDVKTIGRHISNALREELEDSVVANFATTAADGKTYLVAYYNLDMIISVGYRVKSARGVQFRRWANGVLRQYLMQGYAANTRRLEDVRFSATKRTTLSRAASTPSTKASTARTCTPPPSRRGRTYSTLSPKTTRSPMATSALPPPCSCTSCRETGCCSATGRKCWRTTRWWQWW